MGCAVSWRVTRQFLQADRNLLQIRPPRASGACPGPFQGPPTAFAGRLKCWPLGVSGTLGASRVLQALQGPPGTSRRLRVTHQVALRRRCPNLFWRTATSSKLISAGTRLVWTSPACRPRSNCSKLEATSLKKTKGLEPPPNPNWHPSGLDKSSLQTQIQLFKIGSN